MKSATPSARYLALVQLLRTAETLWEASRAFFARWDLSPSQFNVLNVLHGRPDGCTQVELSRDLIMHKSNVTGLVDRLEARRLAVRRDDAKDRRAYRVVLTAEGKRLLHEILPHYHRAAEEVWGDLSPDKAGELLARLDRVCANARRIASTQAAPFRDTRRTDSSQVP